MTFSQPFHNVSKLLTKGFSYSQDSELSREKPISIDYKMTAFLGDEFNDKSNERK